MVVSAVLFLFFLPWSFTVSCVTVSVRFLLVSKQKSLLNIQNGSVWVFSPERKKEKSKSTLWCFFFSPLFIDVVFSSSEFFFLRCCICPVAASVFHSIKKVQRCTGCYSRTSCLDQSRDSLSTAVCHSIRFKSPNELGGATVEIESRDCQGTRGSTVYFILRCWIGHGLQKSYHRWMTNGGWSEAEKPSTYASRW